MKPMNEEEKARIKFRYATALYKALKKSGFENFKTLALHGGMEPAHIQRISTAKVDVSLTTSVAIAKALGISYVEYAAFYEGVTQADIDEYLSVLEEQKVRRGGKTSGK